MEIFDIHHHLGSLTGGSLHRKKRAGRTGTTTIVYGSCRPTV